jgi:cytochrome b561
MTSNTSQQPYQSTPESYGRGAIVFHWAVALLIVWVGFLGLMHDSWPKESHVFWINIHALFGLGLWSLVIARYWWRVTHTPPGLPTSIGPPYRHLSHTVHLCLYALLFITPIIGIVTFIWHGRVFDLGLFRVDFRVPSNRAVFGPTEDIHGYLAYALFALAGVHIAAALWHHFIRRDGILARMWPSRSMNNNS